ncbi:MAG: uracil-DNA glycosylase [Bacteroidia bacterium]|nr:uracil-DNA glycosylase [Bacteroidia bacterium]
MTNSQIRHISPEIHPSWLEVLQDEFQKPYFADLKEFLVREKMAGKTVFPPGKQIFSAFDSTPFDKVKVVILGQDPYHNPGQAHGMCFSVQPGVKAPPSLINIYKEMESDLGIPPADHGYLMKWAEQGVFLLNSILTVQAFNAASHQGKGWERFTDAVIQQLNDKREGLVFILWGGYAKKKGEVIDTRKHLVLKSTHPSPLSAYNGFFGSKPFSQTNAYLTKLGKTPIDWRL